MHTRISLLAIAIDVIDAKVVEKSVCVDSLGRLPNRAYRSSDGLVPATIKTQAGESAETVFMTYGLAEMRCVGRA
ncbi:MAG: hypothetical protein KAY65_08360 [Planctomycetes bacterium]|nr:hypothetical protein [Planctomycetota bacterium]